MALFADDRSPSPDEPAFRPSPRPFRERFGGWAAVVATVIAVIFALLPSPYVIERPGPVYDTLGTAEHDGEEVPLIAIPDEKTYPTEGELNLLTVSVVGRPGATPSWFEVMTAWFDRRQSVVPVEAIFPAGVTDEDRDAQNAAAMVDSQQDAIAAALVELGYDFPREVTVSGVAEGSAAEGVLEDDDVIEAVNGVKVFSIDELRAEVQANGGDAPAELRVLRDGEQQTLEVTPNDSGGVYVLGVGVRMVYEFPIDVELQLDDVGGPSAGMMFALGIVDELTPGAMTGGEIVAGTGTIDSAGAVGAIGGIRQKLWGAKDAGATVFLAPASNCDEVVGNVPDGLDVFAVETLDQAREVVEAAGEGADLGEFATCTVS
ncbi:PDZ domain-containing protein [Agromyces sp. CF514]|uniref:YlbL family protein n=1 Tax=Agromyces sp. CF514 TaxID=1881031 RepID=UPI0008E68392|nr:S16 family serine protease [Agromyces sp. CF514]SFR74546.1 PDZ domain-containing protein [Agromyces sp. CF514]